jgi:hypothetical protein
VGRRRSGRRQGERRRVGRRRSGRRRARPHRAWARREGLPPPGEQDPSVRRRHAAGGGRRGGGGGAAGGAPNRPVAQAQPLPGDDLPPRPRLPDRSAAHVGRQHGEGRGATGPGGRRHRRLPPAVVDGGRGPRRRAHPVGARDRHDCAGRRLVDPRCHGLAGDAVLPRRRLDSRGRRAGGVGHRSHRRLRRAGHGHPGRELGVGPVGRDRRRLGGRDDARLLPPAADQRGAAVGTRSGRPAGGGRRAGALRPRPPRPPGPQPLRDRRQERTGLAAVARTSRTGGERSGRHRSGRPRGAGRGARRGDRLPPADAGVGAGDRGDRSGSSGHRRRDRHHRRPDLRGDGAGAGVGVAGGGHQRDPAQRRQAMLGAGGAPPAGGARRRRRARRTARARRQRDRERSHRERSRERVASVGGELQTGRRPDGGYRLAVTLPVLPAS